MPAVDAAAFASDRARAALGRYAAVSHLTVQVHGVGEELLAGPLDPSPLDPSPLFELFAPGRHDPGLFANCLRRCLTATEGPSAVVVEDHHGLALVGTALRLAGEIVAVAVAGYVLTKHLDQREIERLARDGGLSFETVWRAVRRELPVSRARLVVSGELLGVLGETLLSEHYRTRLLEDSAVRLAEADEAKDRFLAVVSHELRSPLHAILGWTQVLRCGKRDEALIERALDTIERNARAQAHLIDDLLDVSRIIAGKLRLDPRPIELRPVIEAALDVVRPAAEARRIRLVSELDAPVGRVLGDPTRLQQVMWNLLANAVKFNVDGGHVVVRLRQEGSQLEVTVTDTGQGIHPDFLPRIFDRLSQADTTTARAHGGLGLGLAIVRHLVARHGGTVGADSPGEGQGASFVVTLPLAADGEGGEAERTEASQAVGSGAGPQPRLQGLRVLVVDDDADSREVLATIIQQAGGSVSAAESAAVALARLDSAAPDILVVDIGMPGEDGYAVIRKIRARGTPLARIPAAAVTAHTGEDDRARALAAGFDRHVPKPIDAAELVAVLAQLAGRPR